MVRRHDNVIARTAGQQLTFQGLVRVKHVVDRLDPRGLLEIHQGGFADVIGPVVDVNHRLSLGYSEQTKGRGGANYSLTQKNIHRSSSLLLELSRDRRHQDKAFVEWVNSNAT